MALALVCHLPFILAALFSWRAALTWGARLKQWCRVSCCGKGRNRPSHPRICWGADIALGFSLRPPVRSLLFWCCWNIFLHYLVIRGQGSVSPPKLNCCHCFSSHSAATMVLCIRGDGHHAALLWGLASGQRRSYFFAFLNAKHGWTVAGCSPVRKPYPLLWICCSPGLHMAFPGHWGQEGRGWQYIWHLGCYFHCLGFPGVRGDTT